MNRELGATQPGQLLADCEGWDSLAVLGFIALADGDLSVRLEGKQLNAAKSVDDLVAMLANKLEG